MNEVPTRFLDAFYTFSRGWEHKRGLGASINYVSRRGGGVLAKCLCYYISLCSKLADGGGGGGQKLAKSCLVVYGCPLTGYLVGVLAIFTT